MSATAAVKTQSESVKTIPPTELQRKLLEIKDLLRYRMPRLGLAPTIEALRPEIWQLRFLGYTPAPVPTETLEDEFTVAQTKAFVIYNEIAPLLNLIISYESLQNQATLPHWTFQYLLHWVNSWIDFCTANIVLELHRENAIEGLIADELKMLLRSASEQFGGYAAVLDVWKPDPTQLPQPLLNARIVGASLRSEVNTSWKYPIEEVLKKAA